MVAPTKLTNSNRVKLEYAAAIDASIPEMAYYCDVTRQTIYNWLNENPDLFYKIERLREKPVLTARKTVAEGVAESYSNAMDYLKRKKKEEFSERSEFTGKDGSALFNEIKELPNEELSSIAYGSEEGTSQERIGEKKTN